MRGRLDKHDGAKVVGAFLIKAKEPLSLGIAIERDGTSLKPFEGEAWLERSFAMLSLEEPRR